MEVYIYTKYIFTYIHETHIKNGKGVCRRHRRRTKKQRMRSKQQQQHNTSYKEGSTLAARMCTIRFSALAFIYTFTYICTWVYNNNTLLALPCCCHAISAKAIDIDRLVVEDSTASADRCMQCTTYIYVYINIYDYVYIVWYILINMYVYVWCISARCHAITHTCVCAMVVRLAGLFVRRILFNSI